MRVYNLSVKSVFQSQKKTTDLRTCNCVQRKQLMNNLKASNLANQADCELFFYDDLPDEKLDKTLPLDLVGYALSIIRLSNKRKSLSLNISNTYLAKLWGVSVPTVNRKLKLLQEHRIILRMTSGGEKSCDGKFYRTRLIFVRPIRPDPNRMNYPVLQGSKSKLIIHKTTNPKDLDRTLQDERKKQVLNNFISTKELKEIPANKKRKPTKSIKTLQKSFLKQALEKINEMDKLDYRFMCLLLRQVLGAENPSIAHYGMKLHLMVRHRPELVVCAIDGLMNSMGTIRCPIGWFIAELQSVSGFRDLIIPKEEEKLDPAIPKISKEGKRALERFKMEAAK